MDKFTRIFPAVLFSAYFFKLLIKGAGYVDAPVLGILAVIIIALEYKGKDKRMEALEAKFKKMEADSEVAKKEHEQLKTHVSGLKLATQRFNVNGR